MDMMMMMIAQILFEISCWQDFILIFSKGHNSRKGDNSDKKKIWVSYSAGEEKSPYFLFHGETALHKILKFQGETANFSEKFQGEIAEFLRENMELYRQNLKISGRNTGISWRKYWISWRNLEKFSTISPSFSKKKRQLIMEKNKKWGFFFTCTVFFLEESIYEISKP